MVASWLAAGHTYQPHPACWQTLQSPTWRRRRWSSILFESRFARRYQMARCIAQLCAAT